LILALQSVRRWPTAGDGVFDFAVVIGAGFGGGRRLQRQHFFAFREADAAVGYD
jgi:hypothetical protein